MKSELDGSGEQPVHRKIILDVQPVQRKRRRRRGGKRNNPNRKRITQDQVTVSYKESPMPTETSVDNQVPQQERYNEPIPIEMAPLIYAALEYGRRTHALGMMKAIGTLKDANRKLALADVDGGLSSIRSEVQAAIDEISHVFKVAYE